MKDNLEGQDENYSPMGKEIKVYQVAFGLGKERGIEEEKKRSRKNYIIGAIGAVVLAGIAGYFCYSAGVNAQFEKDNARLKENIEMKSRLEWERNHSTTQSTQTSQPESQLIEKVENQGR